MTKEAKGKEERDGISKRLKNLQTCNPSSYTLTRSFVRELMRSPASFPVASRANLFMWTIPYFHRLYYRNRLFSSPRATACDDIAQSIIHLLYLRRNRAVSRAKQNGVATQRDQRSNAGRIVQPPENMAKFARACNLQPNGPCYAI